MSHQVFVIGTGRCGSTLVSNLLRLHPQVTSISECLSFVTDLGCQVGATFPAGSVDGSWLWDRVATPWPRQNLMVRHDVAMEEVLYPFRDGSHRFSAETGIPALSQVTLPHLTDHPDEWLDSLAAEVRQFAPAPVGVQFGRLFDLLMKQTGGSVWAERSGGSLRIAHRLLEHFPRARFVHIVRDGRDVALSMSRHRGFKMVFACFQLLETLGVDPFVSSDRRWEEDMADDLAALLPERFTREAFLNFATPPPLCGHYWSGEIREGLSVLDGLSADRLLTLRYEDFLDRPHDTIGQLVGFVLQKGAKESSSFVEHAATLVRKPSASWQSLDERTRTQLALACKPGMDALAERGFVWPKSGEG